MESMRRQALPYGIENLSLTSLQQRLVKTGGRLVKHARYYWVMLAEGHLTKWSFGSTLSRLAGAAGTEKSIQSQQGTERFLTKPNGEAVASSWGLTLPQSGT
ncbi:MAG TPA: hypothetical protein VNX26_11625 [Candidatus Acidoferrum sp.]|jgi:hypothetical protein|nr:hypothetical protein [Candidatus Acidoferrum sp.]